ncbi:methionyl-tRNA formyltransferase, mitochondrial-like [Hydractinia symbiolongicarpus]|uniref:methionyl-tRNA formyltransferase, mitochondrial-like n=1 Tax=Hydractinia symbiolongicarpus TaxID=13093 RepID=UPI00254F5BCB|nr:methionyl-tRNA formyltransferase, mitochondrial-like [Hydractinia symbiolongicarpus]
MCLILPGVNFFRRNLSSINGLKVLFFGTDDFGVSILDALNKLRTTSSKIVQLDVVASTRVQLVNRQNKVILPPVLQYAEDHQLRDICWKTAKVERSFDDFYDLAVVASFGDFIPSSFISMFSRGAINIHPSLLPRWRGPAPLVHTLLAADEQTGVSVIELSKKKFDVGRILHQEKIQVPNQCTYEQLFTCLSKLSADLIPYVVDNLDDLLKNATEQNEAFATHAPKVDKKSGRINFKCHKCADTDRMQRALPKKLGLSSYWNGMQIKIGNIIRMDAQTDNDSVVTGTCRYDKKSNSLALKMKDGWIYFESVKVQNRKKISARSFYNGYIVNKNTRDENEIKFENFQTD